MLYTIEAFRYNISVHGKYYYHTIHEENIKCLKFTIVCYYCNIVSAYTPHKVSHESMNIANI